MHAARRLQALMCVCFNEPGREVQHPGVGLAAGGLPALPAHHVRAAHARHGHQAAALLCGCVRHGVLALRPQLDIPQVPAGCC